MNITVTPRILHFKQPAGTSRGTLTERRVWHLTVTDPAHPGVTGRGECAPLPGLSCDDIPEYETVLHEICHTIECDPSLAGELVTLCHRLTPTPLTPDTVESANAHRPAERSTPSDVLSDKQPSDIAPDRFLILTRDYPSIRFGLETAVRNLIAGGGWRLWNTPFSRGETGIITNGLIWMGTFDEMYARIREKMQAGFDCIKLKIGAIDFERELALLAYIRKRFGRDEIELRVDANGAFTPDDAPDKLRRLAAFDLHSIEQPIRARQWDEMARLCRESPLDIALDEELIGINTLDEKCRLLDTIRPRYIILKPSLHGGLSGATQWIALARQRGIGYWVTSALESNIGLNAIAQWTATLHPTMPQGLGTGMLFTDNIPSPLVMKGERLWMHA